MKAKTEDPGAEARAAVAPRRPVARRAVEKVLLTLPQELVERLTEMGKQKGLAPAAYMRLVLTDHLTSNSMEDVDRQLWELAKRAEKGGRTDGDLGEVRGKR